MTITNEAFASKLKIALDYGVDEDGKSVTKNKTYSHVKSESTDEAIYGVAKTLCNLQDHGIKDVYRIDEVILKEA